MTRATPPAARTRHVRRGGVLLLSAAMLGPAGCNDASGQEDWQTLSGSRQYAGEQALAVEIEYGAGRLTLVPADENTLYRASIRYDAEVFEPKLEYADNRLEVGFREGHARNRRNVRGGQLELALGSRAPIDLDLQFGAAEANIELGGLRLRSLDMATGASATRLTVSSPNLIDAETVEIQAGAAKLEARGLANLRAATLDVSGGVGEVLLDFSGEWTRDLEASIEMGLGALTLQLPQGLGVRITRGGFLAGFDGEGLIKRGNVYYSENYENASHRLSLKLEAALGSVRVVWVDG